MKTAFAMRRQVVSSNPRVLESAGPRIRHIPPGSPRGNGTYEVFDRKLKDERLHQEIVSSLVEARIVVGIPKSINDRIRPHIFSGCRSPAPVTFPKLAFRLTMAATMQ